MQCCKKGSSILFNGLNHFENMAAAVRWRYISPDTTAYLLAAGNTSSGSPRSTVSMTFPSKRCVHRVA